MNKVNKNIYDINKFGILKFWSVIILKYMHIVFLIKNVNATRSMLNNIKNESNYYILYSQYYYNDLLVNYIYLNLVYYANLYKIMVTILFSLLFKTIL